MRLRIVARALPTHGKIHVGLQERREAVGLVPAGTLEARWETEIDVVDRDGERDFRGPAVQGKRGGRFVYLTYGDLDAGEYTMRGRAKLMLDDAPAVDHGAAVTVTVTVTDHTGRVRTARLRPPVATWTVD